MDEDNACLTHLLNKQAEPHYPDMISSREVYETDINTYMSYISL